MDDAPILFMDEHYVVACKPAGMLVHPSKEAPDRDTLLQTLQIRLGKLYPLHRLDRNTSGCVVFARSSGACSALQTRWNTELVTKTYACMVYGRTATDFVVDRELSAKKDRTKKHRIRTRNRAAERTDPGNARARVTCPLVTRLIAKLEDLGGETEISHLADGIRLEDFDLQRHVTLRQTLAEHPSIFRVRKLGGEKTVRFVSLRSCPSPHCTESLASESDGNVDGVYGLSRCARTGNTAQPLDSEDDARCPIAADSMRAAAATAASKAEEICDAPSPELQSEADSEEAVEPTVACRTEFKTLAPLWERDGSGEHTCSLVLATLKSGRRHQIRRHLASVGHPILGDREYGKGRINAWLCESFELRRMFLHCCRLEFAHPLNGSTVVVVCCALPADLSAFLARVPGDNSKSVLRTLSHGEAPC